MSDEELLRVIELRTMGKPISGTLCRLEGLANSALNYFSIDSWEELFTNPFTELEDSVILRMDRDMALLLARYNNHYNREYSDREIQTMIKHFKKLGLRLTSYKNRISITANPIVQRDH